MSHGNHAALIPSGAEGLRRRAALLPDFTGDLTMHRLMLLAAVVCLVTFTAKAQDPVQVEPKHHKVEFENAQVRVLRITVGPHEKTAAHQHPDWVATALTDVHAKNTFPDGKAEERHLKAGEAQWHAGEKHVVENLDDKPFEVVMVELKGKAAKAKPGAKKKD